MGALFYACKKDENIYLTSTFLAQFEMPKMVFPMNNPQNATSEKLGRYLFYNPVMSQDSSVSCASCHLPNLAFTDGRKLGIGVNNQLTKTNSPTLTNIGFNPYFTRAGGVPSLEIHVLVPIQEHNEFNTNILDIEQRLTKDSFFVSLARQAYPNRPFYFAITASIAAFERTLISDQSKFDYYLKGETSMSHQELEGMRLFYSTKTNCSQCHAGFNFTNYAFENNGAAKVNLDSGRYLLTRAKTDIGQFKVPTLRNIELTGPYMHDGSIHSIRDVIKSYNHGGNYTGHKNEKYIKPLNLSKAEMVQLEAFLKTLTDFDFIRNPKFNKL